MRLIAMPMGSMPHGLGPHLHHEMIGWPKTIIKLKILIFFIKKIFIYGKNDHICLNFTPTDPFLLVLDQFYCTGNFNDSSICPVRPVLDIYFLKMACFKPLNSFL